MIQRQNVAVASTRDINAALVAADSLRSHANIFLDKLGRDMSTAHINAGADMGGLIASATEMTFAVELYLKALRATLDMSVPRSHDLWNLYRDVPSAIDAKIEQHFSTHHIRTPGIVASLVIRVMTAPSTFNAATDDRKAKPRQKPRDFSVAQTLKDNANAFVTWRYFYEAGKSGQVVPIEYNFHDLETAAMAIRDTAIELQHQKRRGA